MLMYHLLPIDPRQFGDILLFADRDELLEELSDWKEYYRNEYKLVGKYRLIAEFAENMLPGSIEG